MVQTWFARLSTDTSVGVHLYLARNQGDLFTECSYLGKGQMSGASRSALLVQTVTSKAVAAEAVFRTEAAHLAELRTTFRFHGDQAMADQGQGLRDAGRATEDPPLRNPLWVVRALQAAADQGRDFPIGAEASVPFSFTLFRTGVLGRPRNRAYKTEVFLILEESSMRASTCVPVVGSSTDRLWYGVLCRM